MASPLEDKIVAMLVTNPTLEHETLQAGLNFSERQWLLSTVRDMEQRNILRRDLTLKRDGKAVLRYLRVSG